VKVRAAADLAVGWGREHFEREMVGLRVGYWRDQSPTTGRINGYSFTTRPPRPSRATGVVSSLCPLKGRPSARS